MRPTVAALALLAVAVSGCVTVQPASLPSDPDSREAGPRVVVAVPDSGINFFHESFRVGSPAPTFVEATTLSVPSEGDLQDRLDAFPWDLVKEGRIYWIEGTRILAITFGEPVFLATGLQPGRYPLYDEYGHGTGVGWQVLHANPQAWLVAIEAPDEAFGEALDWAADQPWIDVVSISFGYPANLVPVGVPPHSHTHRIAGEGKLVVVGAGNDPTLTVTDDYDGPPWVISVGGARNDTKGWAVMSSVTPDVASDYVSRGPVHDDVAGDEVDAGTSTAAPIVAGVLSRAVLEARVSAGHAGGIEDGLLVPSLGIGAREVRDALNATGLYWGPGEYDASAGVGQNPFTNVLFASTPMLPRAGPAGPWVQSGWGYVNASLAPLLADVLLGRAEAPAKPAEAREFMGLYYQARVARWPPP